MRLLWLLVFTLISAGSLAAAEKHWLDEYRKQEKLFNEEGYRISRYRSPTPESSEDAVRISTQELSDWLGSDDRPVLLDVLPLQTFGTEFVQTEPRLNIPGSMWLPNVGRGELEPWLEAYFKRGLQRLTQGDRTRAVVIYCRADCWMSWNAVKRARAWGYTRLYWYRDGMSGWRDFGLVQQESEPVPLDVMD